MMRSLTFLLFFVAAVASEEVSRNLKIFDKFYPELDTCLTGYDENGYAIYGTCDTARFPVCGDSTLICFNRKPMRNKFYRDNRQPHFFIDYANVYCYPDDWKGCSSCTPGRYCASEERCILDDLGYPCEKWF